MSLTQSAERAALNKLIDYLTTTRKKTSTKSWTS